MKKLLVLVLLLASTGCTRNVDYIMAHAEAKWNELGYTVTGYEGFQMSLAGGDVWYQLKRKDTPGVIFHGYLESYYGQLQVYGPTVIVGNQLNLTGKVDGQ